MHNAITDVSGKKVGHYSDREATTDGYKEGLKKL